MNTRRTPWTTAMIEHLVRLYQDTPTSEIAIQLGTTTKRVYSKAAQLGLKKSAAYLAGPASGRLRGGHQVGAKHRFQPGHPSWNKGMKGLDIGCKETRFKKGHRGGKALEVYQPIGAERLSKDGYLQRKINDDMPLQKRWRSVHCILWESINGPLPPGHAIVFKDGDKKNIAIGNLELVTRGELMRRNSYHANYPKEVAQLIQLRGALNRKIHNILKKETDEQRDHC